MSKLDPTAAEQLVLDQMDHNPARHQGLRNIRHNISLKTGIHLAQDFVMATMHTHDPEGFTKRNPTAKHIHCEPKVPLGINERWLADGHDKLNSIGFPLYAFVDDATGWWLGVWVLPSNWFGDVITYLYLEAVEKAGLKPKFNVSDCQSS